MTNTPYKAHLDSGGNQLFLKINHRQINHTPAPWSVCVHEDETTIEACYQTVATQVSNCDAHLIAAAPDMLAALLNAERRFNAIGYETAAAICRAAINSATRY